MTDSITLRQREYIDALCHQLHITQATALVRCPSILADAESARQFGFGDLTKSGASELIAWLIGIRDGNVPMPAPPGQTSLFGGAS